MQNKALYFFFFLNYTKVASSREQTPERYLYENYNNNIYKVIQPFSKLNN